MKRCPECRRDYFDDSLLYCLDDGTALLEGTRGGELLPSIPFMTSYVVSLVSKQCSSY
jgi:hypothetical protein